MEVSREEMLEFAKMATFHLDDRLVPFDRTTLRAEAWLLGYEFAKRHQTMPPKNEQVQAAERPKDEKVEVGNVDSPIWKELPSQELITRLIDAGLTVESADIIIEYHPEIFKDLPDNINVFLSDDHEYLRTWSAKRLHLLLPATLNRNGADLVLDMFKIGDEYHTGYFRDGTDNSLWTGAFTLANALATLTAVLLEDASFRTYYKDNYENALQKMINGI